ncbi:EF-hand domain-containing protein 1-like [Adelges cooleyi]|uniref:EF-hand domain-containing protein 1-like n=1 Tax=Adelges cooleyi TaxID=133065 RepID=UPI002180052C|nr:EF-hand domain-containing protein 1-like [Adelges cooleyi]
MDGLPFLPGFRFNDITKKNYNLSAQFKWTNGYALPREKSIGIGKEPLDVDSILYAKTSDNAGYDPTLTYGKAKDPPISIPESHYEKYDGRCLAFNGFTRVTVLESPVDTYRVRHVKFTYFLVDDTIAIFEPFVENAGYTQGCILRRGPVPNPNRKNRTWHWSDLNNGVELSIYGVTYRLCNCDAYTKQYLSMQGVAMAPDEQMPGDPYTITRHRLTQRQGQQATGTSRRSVEEDRLKQFLINDGKVLRFYAVWDDDWLDTVERKYFIVLYYLTDGEVAVFESKVGQNSCGKDPFPVFLNRIRLPKDRNLLPATFPTIYLESGEEEIKEYYQPKDFVIGNFISVLGRKFLLYDCDQFTRDYFKEMLNINQPGPIEVTEPDSADPANQEKYIPPYTGIGSPEDTLQNCFSLMPKPPKTLDFVTYVLNAAKKLRYKLKLACVREEDKHREFIMAFCLGNDQMTIQEAPSGKNTGFIKGRFMSSVRLRKPNTNVDDQMFYGTKDFAIGAEIWIRGAMFIIVGLDLWTYNYMVEHPHMFTQEAIDGAKKYLEEEGLLNKHQEKIESKPESEQQENEAEKPKTKDLFGDQLIVENID